MAWSKTKSAIVAGAVALGIAGTIISLPFWHRGDNLSEGHRVIDEHIAVPLVLGHHITTPATRFDQITGFPAFKSIPRGFQVFNHVPFQIEGLLCLWGGGNAKDLGIIFPEQNLGIAVNQKVETLYLYHTSFFSSKNGTPVCDVVLRYSDGSSSTNQLCYSSDIFDWTEKRKPTGPNSRLAWRGGTFTPGKDQPLSLCMTEIINPMPLLEVSSIDLYSCKSRSAPVIMAMTVGRSGLMK